MLWRELCLDDAQMPKKSTSSGPHVNTTTSVAIYGTHYAQKLSIMVPIMAKTLPIMIPIMLTDHRASFGLKKTVLLKSCLIL